MEKETIEDLVIKIPFLEKQINDINNKTINTAHVIMGLVKEVKLLNDRVASLEAKIKCLSDQDEVHRRFKQECDEIINKINGLKNEKAD